MLSGWFNALCCPWCQDWEGHDVSTCLGHPHSDYGAQTVAAGDIRTRSVTFSAECCASQLKMEKMWGGESNTVVLSSAVRAAVLADCAQEDSLCSLDNSQCSWSHCNILQSMRLGGLGQWKSYSVLETEELYRQGPLLKPVFKQVNLSVTSLPMVWLWSLQDQ